MSERQGRFVQFDPRETLKEMWAFYPSYKRLAMDTFRLEPLYFTISHVYNLWSSVESVILLYFSSRILQAIETSLKGQEPDVKGIVLAIVARLLCVSLTTMLKEVEREATLRVKSSLELYFDELSLRSKLKRDLPMAQEHSHSQEFHSTDAWYALGFASSYMYSVIKTIALLFFISQSGPASSSGSPMFTLVCLVYPLAEMASRTTFRMHDSLAFTSNENYHRMKSLQKLAIEKYKKDILSGDIMEYIMAEHAKAREALGGVPTLSMTEIGENKVTRRDLLLSLLTDLPMVYYAAQAIFHPNGFSMANIAILQQSHHSLRSTVYMLLGEWAWIRRDMGSLKQMYAMLDMPNSIIDGEVPYPAQCEEKSQGMGIELRNVSFAYPGSKSDKNALDGVSLSIKPGSLVVVVGSNGSGKSTLVNLLARLYDVTSGSVLIDSAPIQSYRLADLRRATAVLTQDHHLFPLSVRENIGLGNSARIDDDQTVMDSAKRGGAAGVILRFKQGLGTVLDPFQLVSNHINAATPKDHPLNVALRALPKPSEVSGGEKQRLVASRMFMRFTSGHVRLVCVDEPSSALDPEAEFQLFNNLREVRHGKTMIFVTHRFGHLARYADLILYMQDGRIAEQGTHEELIKQAGGYARQYDIQASAFIHQNNLA